MYFKQKHYIIFCLLVLVFYLNFQDLLNSFEYETEIQLIPEQCLQLIGSHRIGPNSWEIRFFNACGDKLYANACIEERPGKFKLHNSGGKIPSLGYWNLYSYEGSQPVSISIASGKGMPGIPGQCAAPS